MSELDQSYSLPTEIDTEIKIKWGIPVAAIGSALFLLLIAQNLETYVYSSLKAVWYIYNAAIGLFFAAKSSKNKGKRNISSLLIYFTRDRKTYKPIDNPKDNKKIGANLL